MEMERGRRQERTMVGTLFFGGSFWPIEPDMR